MRQATGKTYVAIASIVTLHHVSACDQCNNQTADLCTNIEVDNGLVGTGGTNGVVGPTLSEASRSSATFYLCRPGTPALCKVAHPCPPR